MAMKLLASVLLLAAVLPLHPVAAEVAAELKQCIPAPQGMRGDLTGYRVAANGVYTVAGGFCGCVKVFDSNTGALLHLLTDPEPSAVFEPSGVYFGNAVGIAGSVVVVSDFSDDTVGEDVGSAYIYDLAGPSPAVPILILRNPDPAVADLFGFSVAISGNHVVVGAYLDDTGATDAGSSYVYNLGGLNPAIPIAVLRNPSPGDKEYFGYSVAISESRVVVCAMQDDGPGADAGAVYVYDIAGLNNPVPTMVLYNPEPTAFDAFGQAVGDERIRIPECGNNYSSVAVVLTSPDGITWTRRETGMPRGTTPFSPSALSDITWTGDEWVAIGVFDRRLDSRAVILTSPDAIAWTPRTSITGSSQGKWLAAYGRDRVVVASDNVLQVSDPILPRPPVLDIERIGTDIRLLLTGRPGRSYDIEESAQLESPSWSTIQTLTLEQSFLRIPVPTSAASQRFWRVRPR